MLTKPWYFLTCRNQQQLTLPAVERCRSELQEPRNTAALLIAVTADGQKLPHDVAVLKRNTMAKDKFSSGITDGRVQESRCMAENLAVWFRRPDAVLHPTATREMRPGNHTRGVTGILRPLTA
jgi:hypothetical protein